MEICTDYADEIMPWFRLIGLRSALILAGRAEAVTSAGIVTAGQKDRVEELTSTLFDLRVRRRQTPPLHFVASQ